MPPITVTKVDDLAEARKLVADPESRAYRPIGHALELFQARDAEVVAESGADCVAGETRIYDPVAGTHTAIDRLYWDKQAPWVLTMAGPERATIPFIKGVADLWRVTLDDGRACIVTARHVVVSAEGWRCVDSIRPGDMIGIGAPFLPASTSDTGRQALTLGAPHSSRTREDSTTRYAACSCPGDAPLHEPSGSGLDAARPRGDVPVHSRDDQRSGDPLRVPGHSRLYQSADRRATSDYSSPSEAIRRALSRGRSSTLELSHRTNESGGSSLTEIHPETPIGADHQRDSDTRSRSAIVALPPPHTDMIPQWMTVSRIEYVRRDVYYDITVPGAGHYLAEGIWHHNTGKSRACLEKLFACARKYPRMRGAIIRKTRASLTNSAMETWEKFVAPVGSYRLWHDQEYRFPNKSKLALLGLDDPGKALSSEYDMIYVQECSELDESDWEILRTRVTGRGAVMPYVQLLADMNPVQPDFWLYGREAAGKVRFIHFTHEDNPTMTPARLAALDSLTGYRYKRLRLGLRVAAEGMYFEEWSPEKHLCEPFDIPAHWPRWASVDYGFAAPWCVLFAARDPATRRIYIYREIYQTQVRDEIQARTLRPLVVRDGVRRIAADPSMFNERKEQGKVSIAQVYGQNGVVLTKASNARIAGWQAVRRILAWNEHEPRLQVMRGRAPNLVRTLPAMVVDPLDSEDLAHEIKGKETDDHACLVAGTMIETEHGHVPIERVLAGDRVWTRGGLRLVEASMMTDDAAEVLNVTFADGRTLTGTGNHPVWVRDGWVRLDTLSPDDKVWGRGYSAKVKSVDPDITRRPVYNLTVADTHEYIANGILVSNCDCLRYLVVDEAMPAGQRIARDHEVSDE